MRRRLAVLAAVLAVAAVPAQADAFRPPRPAVVSSCSGIINRTTNPDRATRYCNAGSGYGVNGAFCFNQSIYSPAYRFVEGPVRYRAPGTSSFTETAFNVVCPWNYPYLEWTTFRTWGS